jgi:hypothetical protein
VIVLKGEIHEEVMSWNGIGVSNSFVVKDSSGVRVAVVDGAGDVYLAGEVLDGRATEAAPPNAFAVKASDGGVASWIDSSGNLKARGQVIVKGVPYILARDFTTDTYRAQM